MRPTETEVTDQLYECFHCGARNRTTDKGACKSCGGQVHNISKPRDL
ncbi:MAG: rubrerythrin-like domain-containing protein [Halobacteriales archaeon]